MIPSSHEGKRNLHVLYECVGAKRCVQHCGGGLKVKAGGSTRAGVERGDPEGL